MRYQMGLCGSCGEQWPLREDDTLPEHKNPDPSLLTRLDVTLGRTPDCAGVHQHPVQGTVRTVLWESEQRAEGRSA